jgi:ABC-type glycerol-3-phosphate transport system substrate-binding protein
MLHRKVLTYIGTAMLLVTSLAGCDKTETIEITIGMWPESQSTRDLAMFDVWKTRFEEDYPQYTIKGAPYQYSVETVHAKAQANRLPTVFQTWFTEPGMLISNGYIKDITDDLQALGWYDKMDTTMRNALMKENRIYGVPRDGYGLGLFLNLEKLTFHGIIRDVDSDGSVDLYDELGEPMYPTTFQEIYEVSQIINENSEGQEKGLLILSANKTGGWQYSNIAWNFGATLQRLNTDTNRWEGTLNDDKAIEALQWIQMLAQEELLLNNVTLTYSDWYTRVTDQVAMAIVGSDVISLAVTNGGMDLDNIAFVPMPKGPYGDQYSLFGGTPYVFASNATDDQVRGALLFLEYMGRSPEVSEVALLALQEGNQVAVEKGIPILPTIKAWSNDDYLAEIEALEEQYVNIDMKYYEDFFNTIYDIRRSEEVYYAQEMYTLLDSVIQEILTNPDIANARTQLTTANATFNNQYMSKLP